MIAEHLGNAIGGQKSLRIHPTDGEHPLPGRQPGAQRLDPRVGREEIVVAHDLNVSVVHPKQVQCRQSGQYHDARALARRLPRLHRVTR